MYIVYMVVCMYKLRVASSIDQNMHIYYIICQLIVSAVSIRYNTPYGNCAVHSIFFLFILCMPY